MSGRDFNVFKTVDVASWQIVGSSSVGRKGLGVNTGVPPIPETMKSTAVGPAEVVLAVDGKRTLETEKLSFTLPSIMVRYLAITSAGTERASRRLLSFEALRTTEKRSC